MPTVVIKDRSEEAKLRELWSDAYGTEEIAARLGRSVSWVQTITWRLRLPPRNRADLARRAAHLKNGITDPIQRRCLLCDKPFEAETRFLRLCPTHRHD